MHFPRSRPKTFQSTLPARGATMRSGCGKQDEFYFNPRSPRGERQALYRLLQIALCISIHAPREGSDVISHALSRPIRVISIHAPREGSDLNFLPVHDSGLDNFNPRSPRGERLDILCVLHLLLGISIHAPREGSDGQPVPSRSHATRFQSTLPARGATMDIPICDARRRFQSTLPARGATVYIPESLSGDAISIHAPREGSDGPQLSMVQSAKISIHAPREGSDPATL